MEQHKSRRAAEGLAKHEVDFAAQLTLNIAFQLLGGGFGCGEGGFARAVVTIRADGGNMAALFKQGNDGFKLPPARLK